MNAHGCHSKRDGATLNEAFKRFQRLPDLSMLELESLVAPTIHNEVALEPTARALATEKAETLGASAYDR